MSIGADERLEIEVEGFDLSHFVAEREALRNKPLEGALEDGAAFTADLAFLDVDRAAARYWTLIMPERPARLWVAQVGGGLGSLDALGNLASFYEEVAPDGTTRTPGTNRHHRFAGAYTYYLVAADGGWFVIVDTGTSDPPTRELVYPDMLGLQFVLGRAFFFDLIVGVDEKGDVVGLVGGRHGRDHGHRPKVQAPVPLELSREHWASEFFEAISRTYRERPKLRLYLALSYYLDALASAHVENTYLVLHVALEGFSYWLLGGDERPEPPLVESQSGRRGSNCAPTRSGGLLPPNLARRSSTGSGASRSAPLRVGSYRTPSPASASR